MPMSNGDLFAQQMRVRNAYISPSASGSASAPIPPIANQPVISVEQARLNANLGNQGTAMDRFNRQASYPADPTSNYSAKTNGSPTKPLSQPTTPSPVSNPSPSAPNSPPANNSGLGGSPKTGNGLGGALGGLGKALGGIGAVLGLIEATQNLGSSIAIIESGLNGQANRNKQAKNAYDDAFKRYEKALEDRGKANPANSKGSSSNSGTGGDTLPTGGRNCNETYRVYVEITNAYNQLFTSYANGAGKVIGLELVADGGGGTAIGVIFQRCDLSFFTKPVFLAAILSASITSIVRTDGLPNTTADLGNTSPANRGYTPPLDTSPNSDFFPYSPSVQVGGKTPIPQAYPEPPIAKPFGFTPTSPSSRPDYDNKSPKEPVKPPYAPVPPPIPAPRGNTDGRPTSTAPETKTPTTPASQPTNNGLGGFTSTSSSQSQTSQSQTSQSYANEANRQPVTTTPTRTDVPPSQAQADLTKPLVPPVTKPVTTTPNTPNQGDSNDAIKILAGLTGLGLLIATIKGLNDQINNQTKPIAQQTNAKQGVCDAMQPQQCGFEGVKAATTEATNPIKNQALANAGLLGQILAAIANLASTFATLFSNVVGKLDGIKEFLEKVANAAKLDKVYNFLTFLTVVHNAQMLSNNLLQTLESTISQGLAVFGIKDGDSPIDINAIINKSTSDMLKSILGESRFNELDAQWKSANKIYQSGANLVYQVRSLYDSGKATAELTGANLGQLMNALKKDGVVTEAAYPHKSESPSQVNSLMDRLQNLESAASHLNSITSNAYGVTETVKQIKDDKASFDKLVEESPLKKGIVNKAATDDAAAKKVASPSPPLTTSDLVKPD